MQFEELLKLVEEVGKAGLSDFEYTEGNLHIKMSAVADQGQAGEVCDGGKKEKNPLLSEESAGKKEVVESPLEGTFFYVLPDGTRRPLKIGDPVEEGQLLGMLESRGQTFEIHSSFSGKVVDLYIEDGEDIVAGEPMLRIQCPPNQSSSCN